MRTDAVGHQAAVRHIADQPLNLRMVDAKRRETVKRDVGDERFERPPQIAERSVEVEMFRIDIGHHGDGRRKLDEGAVRLVGLDDDPFSLAEPCVGAVGVYDSAVDHGGVEVRRFEDCRDDGGRRRLAVRPSDRDGPFETHDLCQHLGTANDGDHPRARRRDLGIVGIDRRAHHHDRRVAEISRVMADADVDPQRAQPEHVRAVGDVAAPDPVSEIAEHLRDAAHADTADTDEMDRSDR